MSIDSVSMERNHSRLQPVSIGEMGNPRHVATADFDIHIITPEDVHSHHNFKNLEMSPFTSVRSICNILSWSFPARQPSSWDMAAEWNGLEGRFSWPVPSAISLFYSILTFDHNYINRRLRCTLSEWSKTGHNCEWCYGKPLWHRQAYTGRKHQEWNSSSAIHGERKVSRESVPDCLVTSCKLHLPQVCW